MNYDAQNPYSTQTPNQNTASQNSGAFSWDSEIRQENNFILLPAGDYRFTIEKIERAHYPGGDKISACPKAVVTFRIYAADGSSTVLSENYLLHQKMEWKLSEFFAAIGLKKKGEPLRMCWTTELFGKSGVCKIIVNKYKKDGEERENNRIDKLYPAYDQPILPPPVQQQYTQPQQPAYTPPSGGWTQGSFN